MAIQLVNASVALTATGVNLDFVCEGAFPARGTVLFTAFLTSADGQVVRQIGWKALDGQVIGKFVFDHSGPVKQVNLKAGPELNFTDRTLTYSGSYPRAAAEGIGAGGQWRAVLNVDGSDLGEVSGHFS